MADATFEPVLEIYRGKRYECLVEFWNDATRQEEPITGRTYRSWIDSDPVTEFTCETTADDPTLETNELRLSLDVAATSALELAFYRSDVEETVGASEPTIVFEFKVEMRDPITVGP